ncbi:MAG TPA: hypothetical protein VK052_14305, partial [Zeimonas sp.]|nr:hypothetical protein [Zeimonas sp.]
HISGRLVKSPTRDTTISIPLSHYRAWLKVLPEQELHALCRKVGLEFVRNGYTGTLSGAVRECVDKTLEARRLAA